MAEIACNPATAICSELVATYWPAEGPADNAALPIKLAVPLNVSKKDKVPVGAGPTAPLRVAASVTVWPGLMVNCDAVNEIETAPADVGLIVTVATCAPLL